MENKPLKVGQINLPDILSTDGLELVGSTPEGKIKVRSKEAGTEFEVADKKAYVEGYLKKYEPEALKDLQQKGMSIDNFDIINNNKDTALDTSPISFTDRAALSFGNMTGSKKYLEEKFDEVGMNSNGDIVVRNGDTWHKVDAKGLGNGDAYDMMREFAGDAADLFGTGVQIIPSLAATTVGGTLAGAAVGTGLKTAMGKALNTYEGDAEEMVQDLGMEMALALGGYGVGKAAGIMGSKAFKAVEESPTIMGMMKGMKELGKNAAEPVKDAIANVMMFATGKPKNSIKHMINNPEGVEASLKTVLSSTKSYEEAVEKLAADNSAIGKSFLQNSLNGIFAKAKAMEDDFLSKTGNMKVDISEGIDRLFGRKPVELANGMQSYEGLLQHPLFGKLMRSNPNTGTVEMISRKQLANMTNFSDSVQVNELYNGLSKFTDIMNKLKKPQDATLKDVLALRRQMDDIIFNGNLNDETIDALRVYTEPFRDNVVSVLKSAPNGAQYTQMTEFLKGNSKNIIEAKRLLKSNNIQAFDNYLKSLMAPTGTASATKGFMDEMASQSPLAAKQLELIKNNEAAKSFMEIAPSMKNLQSGAGLIVGGATYAATQDGNVSALAALPLTSPRTALKAAVLASKTAKVASGLGQRAQAILPSLYNAKEVITRLATSEKAKLLQDPRALGAILGPLVNDINNSQGNEGQ